MERLEVLQEIQIAAIFSLFAAICGILKYLYSVETGQVFTWWGLFIHAAISAASGAATYLLLEGQGVPVNVAGGLCGLAGWMGPLLFRIGEIYIRKFFKVEKEEL